MGSGFLGFSAPEIFTLAVLVLIIVGPERLPGVAKQAAQFLKKAVAYVRDTTDALSSEFGEEIADLKDFDPRQYDPRRIVREAMAEPRPRPATTSRQPGVRQPPAQSITPPARDPNTPAPFDPEAT